MHGIVFSLLKNYVTARHKSDTWFAVLREAGREGSVYMPTQIYPDDEMGDLVAAACRLTATPPAVVLEDFGTFIAPHLMGMYEFLVRPEWKTMGLLLNVEETIHKVVRLKNPGARPPELQFTRIDDHTLRFEYNSPRRMAALAVGIMKGVAAHYGERITIDDQPQPDGGSLMIIRVSTA